MTKEQHKQEALKLLRKLVKATNTGLVTCEQVAQEIKRQQQAQLDELKESEES